MEPESAALLRDYFRHKRQAAKMQLLEQAARSDDGDLAQARGALPPEAAWNAPPLPDSGRHPEPLRDDGPA
jgi:hypothetical protein